MHSPAVLANEPSSEDTRIFTTEYDSDGMLQGSGSGWNLVVMQRAFTATTAAQQNI